MARRGSPEIFGLSLLDTVTCGLGGAIVLMIIVMGNVSPVGDVNARESTASDPGTAGAISGAGGRMLIFVLLDLEYDTRSEVPSHNDTELVVVQAAANSPFAVETHVSDWEARRGSLLPVAKGDMRIGTRVITLLRKPETLVTNSDLPKRVCFELRASPQPSRINLTLVTATRVYEQIVAPGQNTTAVGIIRPSDTYKPDIPQRGSNKSDGTTAEMACKT